MVGRTDRCKLSSDLCMQHYLSLSLHVFVSVSLLHTHTHTQTHIHTLDKSKQLKKKKKSRKWPPQNEGDPEAEACQDQRTWFISWGQEFLGTQCMLLFECKMFPTGLFLNQVPTL